MNLWTGYMGEGKSQFLIYMCLLKALNEDWKFAFFSPENDPPGPLSGTYRVLRGGSWFYEARFLRVAYRGVKAPGDVSDSFGFRCAR